MSESAPVTEQNSLPAQPIPAPKQRRSNKPPALKAAVLIQRANGTTKTQIAKDLEISRGTVDVIIEEANLDEQLSTAQVLSATLLPKAVEAVEKTLVKGDGVLGLNFLKWQLGENPNSKNGEQKALNAVFSGCQVLIQQAISTTKAGDLHKNAAEPSTNALCENAQAPENKEDK